MARPISLELPPRDPREELRKRLEQAPVEHAEALLDSWELLQQLHEHGVFQLLRGALGASDKLIETAVDAAKSDESVRATRLSSARCLVPSIRMCSSALPRPPPKHSAATRSRSLSRRGFSRCSTNS